MEKTKKIIILGGEGNGGVIANAIADANKRGYKEWECVGFLNDRYAIGTEIDSFKVLGALKDVPKFLELGYYFINAILRIDNQRERISMINDLGIPDSKFATFVHPTAYVAPNTKLGPGCVIMPLVAVSSNTTFGKGCIVMVSATIGHDNKIGDYCHIAAQACVGSFLTIGVGAHIGLNSTIRENLVIGKYATLGMGAVLTKNIGDQEIWAGVPAKFLRKAD